MRRWGKKVKDACGSWTMRGLSGLTPTPTTTPTATPTPELPTRAILRRMKRDGESAESQRRSRIGRALLGAEWCFQLCVLKLLRCSVQRS